MRVEQARALFKASKDAEQEAQLRAGGYAALASGTDYILAHVNRMRDLAGTLGDSNLVAHIDTTIAALEDTQEEIQK